MKKRVLVLYMGHKRMPGACEIYRGNMPMDFISRNSSLFSGSWAFFADLIEEFAIYGNAGIQSLVNSYDIFVMARVFIMNDQARTVLKQLFELIRAAGKKIVYEVDDDYSNEFRQVVDGNAIEVASMCDAITVTTEYLGERMKALTGKPYYILPNCIDPQLWNAKQEPTRKVDGITIGLTGSKSHEIDWMPTAHALDSLAKKYDVYTIVGGYHPEYLKGVKNVDLVPALPYHAYSQLIKACDIIIAPVDPTDRFNDGKSAIKAIEGMGARRNLNGQPAGAAVVATNNLVYSSVISHENTGLLVDHNPHAWHEALERLIVDEKLRHKLQKQGYMHVLDAYNIAKKWRLWERAYQKILSA